MNVGITGSWYCSLPQFKTFVESKIRFVIDDGRRIVTGGTLGVSLWATDVALRFNVPNSLVVVIPTRFDIYLAHLARRADEGMITPAQAKALTDQLWQVYNRGALTEMPAKRMTLAAYHARNAELVRQSDSLIAFQVNESAEAQDTVARAEARGIPVRMI